MFDQMKVKFNEPVWHDHAYTHPQKRVTIDLDFYDREAAKEILFQYFNAGSYIPAIIQGERRAGKTSLFKLIASTLENDPDRRFVTVVIPWQGISSQAELMREILHGTCYALDREIPEDLLIDNERISTTRFTRQLQQLLPEGMNKTIVICIDEFDSIIDVAPVAEQGRIIGLANALVEAGNLPVRLLITMTRTPPLPEAEASPLFNKYAPVRLHPFSRTDFEAMLRGLIDQDALALPEEDRDRLFELSGGWPYFVKLLLTSISGEISERGWLDLTVEKALHNPVIEPTMRQIYDIYMDDAEKSILLLLAERGGRLTPAEVNTLGPNYAAAAARLCERDFLIYQKDGTYGFRIGFIGQWLPGWFSFEDEKEKHNLAALLQRIQRMNDPWADGPAPTVVTDEDLADIL